MYGEVGTAIFTSSKKGGGYLFFHFLFWLYTHWNQNDKISKSLSVIMIPLFLYFLMLADDKIWILNVGSM